MTELKDDQFHLRLLDTESARQWSPPVVTVAKPKSAAQKMSQVDEQALLKQKFDEAFQQGLAEGKRAGQEAFNQQLAQLNQLMLAMVTPMQQIDERVEDEMAALSILIGKQLFLTNIRQTPEQVVEVVRRGLVELPVANAPVRILLNPEDARLIEHRPEFEGRLEILEDPSISRGGCQMSAGNSRVDQRVETRIAAIIRTLFDDALPVSPEVISGNADDSVSGANDDT